MFLSVPAALIAVAMVLAVYHQNALASIAFGLTAIASVFLAATVRAMRGVKAEKAGVPGELIVLGNSDVRMRIIDMLKSSKSAGSTALHVRSVRVVLEPGICTALEGGEAHLTVGWIYLAVLRESRLRCLLAHEAAHHDASAMELHNAIDRLQCLVRDVLAGIRHLRNCDMEESLVPAFFANGPQFLTDQIDFFIVVFSAVERLLTAVFRGLKQRYELYCDSVASNVYGADAVVESLVAAHIVDDAWRRVLAGASEGGDPSEIERELARNIADCVATFAERPAFWNAERDEHPSLAKRVAALGCDHGSFTASSVSFELDDVEAVPDVLLSARGQRQCTPINDLHRQVMLVLAHELRLFPASKCPTLRSRKARSCACVALSYIIADVDTQGGAGHALESARRRFRQIFESVGSRGAGQGVTFLLGIRALLSGRTSCDSSTHEIDEDLLSEEVLALLQEQKYVPDALFDDIFNEIIEGKAYCIGLKSKDLRPRS